MNSVKRTKIIATLGPATFSKEAIARLIANDVDVFRINSSHTPRENFPDLVEKIRTASQAADKYVGILLDLQGPKIRTGTLKGKTPVLLEKNASVDITPENIPGDASLLSIPHPDIVEDLKEGDTILFADGMINLRVTARHGERLTCTVIEGGLLGEHKGVNLPGVDLKVSSLTQKDTADFQAGLMVGIDYAALSFVRRAEDILALRLLMENDSRVRIIAKIEKPEGVENIKSILEVSDAIMVARGDLGVEMPLQKVPLIQKDLIMQAHTACKPVIVATQMMESMIEHWQPTRAEVTDVANAVLDGTDACMLSAETAMGKYPDQTTAMMSKILSEVEFSSPMIDRFDLYRDSEDDFTHALAESACFLAKEANAQAILAFTMSGNTALKVSKHRPKAKIYGLSPDENALLRMSLYWGVNPIKTAICISTDEMIAAAKELLFGKHLLNKDDRIVIVAGTNPIPGGTTLVKLDRI